jgi:hypothetical protein
MKKVLLSLLFIASCSPVYAANYLQAPTPKQHVAAAPVSISVTTTSAQVVAINATRTGLECTNLSTTATVTVGYGSNAAIVNGGTAILPGQHWWMDDYLFTTLAINMIGSASAIVACTEFN